MFAQFVKPGIKKVVVDVFAGVNYLLTMMNSWSCHGDLRLDGMRSLCRLGSSSFTFLC